MLATYKILIVDDETHIRNFCRELLIMEGFQAQAAAGSREALTLLAQERFDVLLLDLNMPDMDGLSLLGQVTHQYTYISPIVMTGYATLEAAVTAQDLGVEGFILKPFDDQKLLRIVEQVIERRALRQDYARLQAHIPLLALGHRLMTETDLERLARAVLEIVQQELGVYRMAMWLVDRNLATQQEQLIRLAQQGNGPLSLPQAAQMIDHWFMVDNTDSPVEVLSQAEQVHVPLRTEEGVIGWLSLAHEEPGKFTERDIEFVSVINSHLAIGLENRRLYQTIDWARQEWEAIFDSIQDGIIVHGVDGTIRRLNRIIVTWLNQPEKRLIGQPSSIITIDEHGQTLCDISCALGPCATLFAVAKLQPVQFSSPPWAVERTFRVKTFPLYQGDELVEVVHLLEDITQASRMQAQMVQTEKLSALGRLSASLAHEINNPLQALRSGLRLLSRPKITDEKRKQYVSMLISEVERLVNITTQTLDFARPNRVGKQPVNLNQLLQETMHLVDKQLSRQKINTTLNLMPNLPPIYIVPEQIKQVFINLILNSIDALARGGELQISTQHLPHKRYVVASVIDDGPGIPDEVWEHISEPFFTTKESGTGLGLAISFSIIEAHGGLLEGTNRAEGGCVFSVYLPTERDDGVTESE